MIVMDVSPVEDGHCGRVRGWWNGGRTTESMKGVSRENLSLGLTGREERR